MNNLTGKNLIAATLSAEGTELFQAEDPAKGIAIEPSFHEATTAEVDRAVQAANNAFQSYRSMSGEKKAEFLEAIAEEIVAIGDALIQRCMQETGLPEARLAGERMRTVGQLKLFASLVREGSWVDARIDLADPDRKPLPKPDIRSMLRPLGPVGIFGASNFPLAFSVAGGDTVSALAAGCTVVFKAHPAHPGTCELVGSAIQRAVAKCKMPEGTFSMVHCKSFAVGRELVQHPLIKAIGFTGSYRGGKALFDEANKRPEPIPVYAEMGSTNPVFILPGALKERHTAIAKDLASSVTLGTGQFCTNPGLVFTIGSEEEKKFAAELSASIQLAAAGTMLTESILASYTNGIEQLQSHAAVSLLAHGLEHEGDGYKATAYVLQTRVKSFLNDDHLEEEVFGPSTLTIRAESQEELLLAANKLHGHLTATIHATPEDLADYADLIAILEQKVGRILLNGYPTGVEVTHAMVHGGPFPATSDCRTTSVGTGAVLRFARPVCYQNFPSGSLPPELADGNPLRIWRMVNGERTK